VAPEMDMSKFKLLGTILVHGFMVCGFLPNRIAFPSIVTILLGSEAKISDTILVESFIDFLSVHDGSLVRNAVTAKSLTPNMTSDLINLLSRFECKEIPSSSNLVRLLAVAARHLFLGKAFSILFTMRLGVPKALHGFWNKYSVEELFELYKALNASTSAVLKRITEPADMNAAQARTFSYLLTYIGNMKYNELRLFIRFVTGSSVMTAQDITVYFNYLSGLQRRPISHTCDSGLQLPVEYSTFPEFEQEFSAVLANEQSWIMDSV
jgi:hypothetical protein